MRLSEQQKTNIVFTIGMAMAICIFMMGYTMSPKNNVPSCITDYRTCPSINLSGE